MSNKGATEIMREILNNLKDGEIVTSRGLYNGLSVFGSGDEKADYGAAKRMVWQGVKKGLLEPIMTGKKGKLKRAVSWKKIGSPKDKMDKQFEETFDPDNNQFTSMAKSLQPDEVTDSQIGKSMIYYVDELKKRLADLGRDMDDQRQKLTKTVQDLRDELHSARLELEKERLRANNLQIALNRMRNVPNQSVNQKTFNLGEIATIKR